MSNKKYVENGNALTIKEVCLPYGIPMLQYEAIVSFCIEQLAHIYIKKSEHEGKICCEPIMRFVVDISNEKMFSYAVFSNQRER